MTYKGFSAPANFDPKSVNRDQRKKAIILRAARVAAHWTLMHGVWYIQANRYIGSFYEPNGNPEKKWRYFTSGVATRRFDERRA